VKFAYIDCNFSFFNYTLAYFTLMFEAIT